MIFNRDEDALSRLIQFFEQNAAVETESKADPTEGMTVEQRMHWKIVHRKKEGVEQDIDTLMTQGLAPRGWCWRCSRARRMPRRGIAQGAVAVIFSTRCCCRR